MQIHPPQPFMPYHRSFEEIPAVMDYRAVNDATDCQDPDILERLSESPDPNVKARVAENGRTPISVLQQLAEYQGPHADYIKQYLVRNPVLPFHMLKNMMTVEHPPLRTRIFTRLLSGYKEGRIDLSGEEVYTLLKWLAPADMNDLEFVELLESVHETRDREARKRK